jgi:hypothetical protein
MRVIEVVAPQWFKLVGVSGLLEGRDKYKNGCGKQILLIHKK